MYGNGTTAILNNTITNNSSGSTGGGVYAGTVSILNTIIAGNQSGSGNVDYSWTTLGGYNNQIGIPIGKTIADIFATDANGKPLLTNNGGPTQTIALSVNSPALNTSTSIAILATSLDTVATTFVVDYGTYIPVGESLLIDSEIITVTSVSGTTITVTRAQGGTTAATHAISTPLNLAYDQTGAVRTFADLGAYMLPVTYTLAIPSILAYAKSQPATVINSGIQLSSQRSATLSSATVKLTN